MCSATSGRTRPALVVSSDMTHQEQIREPSGSLPRTGVWLAERSLPDVLCKRRGILYFAGEPARIIGPDTLRDGNVRVPIWLQRCPFYRLADLRRPAGRTVPNLTYSFSCINASLRSSAIPLWPCFSDWEIPFS